MAIALRTSPKTEENVIGIKETSKCVAFIHYSHAVYWQHNTVQHHTPIFLPDFTDKKPLGGYQHDDGRSSSSSSSQFGALARTRN